MVIAGTDVTRPVIAIIDPVDDDQRLGPPRTLRLVRTCAERCSLARHGGDVGQSRAVWRPRESLRAARKAGDSGPFATDKPPHVQLRVVTVGCRKGNPPAIGRPSWSVSLRRKQRLPAACNVNQPQGRLRTIGHHVASASDINDRAAVGTDLRIGRHCQTEQVAAHEVSARAVWTRDGAGWKLLRSSGQERGSEHYESNGKAQDRLLESDARTQSLKTMGWLPDPVRRL